MSSKKIYSTPTLKTQKIQLGVFGDYTRTDVPIDNSGGKDGPLPPNFFLE